MAERKIGELIRTQPKAPGGQPPKRTGVKNTPVLSAEPTTPSLADKGIDRNDARPRPVG
jgi:hypothetical protein